MRETLKMVDVSVIAGSAIRDLEGNRGRISSVSLPWISLKWDVPGEVAYREESLLRSDPKLDTDIEVLTMDRGWCKVGSIVGARESTESVSESVLDELETIVEAAKGSAKKRAASKKENARLKKRRAAAKAAADALLKNSPGAGSIIGDTSVSALPHQERRARKRGEKGKKTSDGGTEHKEHYPFKRKDVLGPGPKKHIHKKADDWDCDAAGKYHQVCVGVKGGKYEGWIKDIWIPPGYKAEYNKLYKQWVKAGSQREGPVGITRFGSSRDPRAKAQTFRPK